MQLWGWLGTSKICGAGHQEKHDGILMPTESTDEISSSSGKPQLYF